MVMLAMTIAGFTSFEPPFRFPAISLTYTHVKAHILVVCMLINMDSAARHVTWYILFSVAVFKSRLKTFLFSQAFSSSSAHYV